MIPEGVELGGFLLLGMRGYLVDPLFLDCEDLMIFLCEDTLS